MAATAAKSVDFPAGVNGGSATTNPANGGEGHRDIEAGGGWASTSAPTTTTTTATQGPTTRGQRLASLDVFRGITVVVSIYCCVPIPSYSFVHSRNCMRDDHGWVGMGRLGEPAAVECHHTKNSE